MSVAPRQSSRRNPPGSPPAAFRPGHGPQPRPPRSPAAACSGCGVPMQTASTPHSLSMRRDVGVRTTADTATRTPGSLQDRRHRPRRNPTRASAASACGMDLAHLAATDQGRPHAIHRRSLREITRAHPPQERQRLGHLFHPVHAVLDAHPALVPCSARMRKIAS